MSMKVERSSLDQVKKRFEANKQKMEEKKKEYDFGERIKELKEEVRTFVSPQSHSDIFGCNIKARSSPV